MATMLRKHRRTCTSLALLALSGCQTGYLLQAASGQIGVLAARRPVESVIADQSTPAPLRSRLTLVRDARNFASQELRLPDNRSYRSFANLKRDYVVWNVVAAPEFSVEPQEWCFPIAGCVAYRGYFRERSAQRFAERLRRRGDDVSVDGVPAYSTLGHFADPVLSTMLRYDDADVVGMIFHELAHQLLYVRSDSVFNESFAMTVEEAGLEAWLSARGLGAELANWRAKRSREQRQMLLLIAARADLAALYKEKLAVVQLRERKRQRLAQVTQELHAKRVLNNADLAIAATYWDCVPGLQRELAAAGGQWSKFYVRAKLLAQLPRRERHQQLCRGT
jgi:predicted aminopeptidase